MKDKDKIENSTKLRVNYSNRTRKSPQYFNLPKIIGIKRMAVSNYR